MGRMGEKGEISEPIAQISTKSSAGALNAVASSPIADYTTEVCIYTDPNMLSVLEDVWERAPTTVEAALSLANGTKFSYGAIYTV